MSTQAQPCVLQRAISGNDEFFSTLDSMLAWLERLGMTLEDAERSILRAANLRPDGVMGGEIVTHFMDAHGVPATDACRVEQLAAFLAFRRKLERISEGRWRSNLFPIETVTALVTVPRDEFGLIAPYVHRGSAAFEREGLF